MSTSIALLGGGGHARACDDILQMLGYSITLGGEAALGTIVQDTRELTDEDWDSLCANHDLFILGVGQIHTPDIRKQIVKEVESRAGEFMTLISPKATVSRSARLGEAVFVGHHAVINTYAKVGDYAILNTGCVLEHDTVVGAFCHISTGAVINGGAKIGHGVFVGSNAVVLQEVTICDEALIGAGSVVINDITEKGVYVGNPAKKIR